MLDLGCGAGDLTLALLARNARVTAVDLSPGMEVARAGAALPGPLGSCRFPCCSDRVAAARGRSLRSCGRAIRPAPPRPHVGGAPDSSRARAGRSRHLRRRTRAEPSSGCWQEHTLQVASGFHVFGTVDEQPLSTRDIEFLAGRVLQHRARIPAVRTSSTDFDRQVLRYRWRRCRRCVGCLTARSGAWLPGCASIRSASSSRRSPIGLGDVAVRAPLGSEPYSP